MTSEISSSIIWNYIRHLEPLYPGMDLWFEDRVAPGLLDGKFKAFVKHDGDRICGIVIASREHVEPKICTVYVSPGRRGEGIAKALIAEACDWLGTEHPYITLSDQMLDILKPSFERLGFFYEKPFERSYRPGSVEYVFRRMVIET